MRTATVTVTSWTTHKQWLLEQAHHWLPIVQWLKGIIWPKFWDSPAMAVNLSHAASCFPGDGGIQAGALLARGLIDKQKWTRGSAAVKVQGIATKALREALYKDTITVLFAKRLSALLPDRQQDLARVDWPAVCAVLQSLPMHQAMCAVKTYTNSWATSVRYHHEHILPCIFGCQGARDELQHYIVCTRLWRAVRGATAGRTASESLEKLSLVNPSKDKFKRIGIAFTIYHAMRKDELAVVHRALGSQNFYELAQKVRSYAAGAAHSFGCA